MKSGLRGRFRILYSHSSAITTSIEDTAMNAEEEVIAAARAIIDAANDGNLDRGTSEICN